MLSIVLLCCVLNQAPAPTTGPGTAPVPRSANGTGTGATAQAAGTDLAKAARQIISRAIEAHGGKAQLTKVHADRVKLKGKMVVGKTEVPYAADTMVQLPNQFRNTVQFNQGKKDVTMVQVINGEKVALWINGTNQKLPLAMEEEIRQSFALNRAIRLISLLEDSAFELAYLGKEEETDRNLLVVRVTRRGLRELRMFFEEKTGYLVKTEHPVDYQGKPYLQQEHYSDFRDLSGFRRPVKMEIMRGGQKILEATLTQVNYPESIPPEFFETEGKP